MRYRLRGHFLRHRERASAGLVHASRAGAPKRADPQKWPRQSLFHRTLRLPVADAMDQQGQTGSVPNTCRSAATAWAIAPRAACVDESASSMTKSCVAPP